MNASNASPIYDSEQPGSFNYLVPSVESSLYRNGKVLTRRDADGSDAGTEGVELESRAMEVHNARELAGEAQCSLHRNGFVLLDRPPPTRDLDFFDHAAVTRTYYPDCAQVVRDASGASFVAAFDHNVRSARGKASKQRIAGGQQVQGPAHVVHGDYTLTSAPQRLRDLARVPGGNDTLREVLAEGQTLLNESDVTRALDGGRFAIINVWRNITDEPVATRPLALCDGQSVEPEDLVVFEIHYADRVGENYFAKHSAAHNWFYYPQMVRDEALLIKQWDSLGTLAVSGGDRADHTAAGEPCTFSFHSAFIDPAAPDDAPDRWSIEVRCVALFD